MPGVAQAHPSRAVAGRGVEAVRWVGPRGQSSVTQRNVQAEREELRDSAEYHDDGNHQVDDAAAMGSDMLAGAPMAQGSKGWQRWSWKAES